MQISLFLRDNKGVTAQRIWALFRVNKKILKIDTFKKIEPRFWSTSKQAILPSNKYSKDLNRYLSQIKTDIEKVVIDLQNEKKLVDRLPIQERLNDIYKVQPQIEANHPKDFISFMDDYIKHKEILNCNPRKTMRLVRTNVILAFGLATKNQIENYKNLPIRQKAKFPLKSNRLLEFSEINIHSLMKFQAYMHTTTFKRTKNGGEVEQYYKKNHINKQVKLLKQFVSAAQSMGYVPIFDISFIKIVNEDVDSVYLDMTDLQKMCNLDLTSSVELEKVRDWSVINCFLGLRFSDLRTIKENNFTFMTIRNVSELIYNGRNKKTDKKIEFVVHPSAARLLKKYNYTYLSLSQKEFNKRIKVICRMARLKQLISIRETRGKERVCMDLEKWEMVCTHTGRRSFCTNYFVKGVPIQHIMSISGHSSEKEFLKYVNKRSSVDIQDISVYVRSIEPLAI